MSKELSGVFEKFQKASVGLVISIRLFVVRIKQFSSQWEKINGFCLWNVFKNSVMNITVY